MLAAFTGGVSGFCEMTGAPEDHVWQLWRVTGDASGLERVEAVARKPLREPLIDRRLLARGDRGFLVASRWRRPREDDGATLEHLIAHLAWQPVPVETRLRAGRVHVRAIGASQASLRDLMEDLRARFGAGFSLELVRTGGLRPPHETDTLELTSLERDLLEAAFRMGYYDQPKECGVRELAAEVGMSKSAVGRRLRDLERRALAGLRDEGRTPRG